jgi:ABC-2 type transport system permease protein
MSAVLHQARYELRAFLRNKQARYFTLVMPLVLLVIFVGVFGDDDVGHGVEASSYYVPGIAALAVVAASFANLVISITAQRETGVLKRRRATPVPAWALVAGRSVTATAVSLVSVAVLLAVGRLAHGVDFPASALPAIALTAIVGSAAFCALGYAVSTRIHSADAAQPVVQAILLPLYFSSGVFVPKDNLPDWLRNLAALFPVEHLADALHHAYDPAAHATGVAWGDLAVLAAWGLAGLAVALRRFAWTPSIAAA